MIQTLKKKEKPLVPKPVEKPATPDKEVLDEDAIRKRDLALLDKLVSDKGEYEAISDEEEDLPNVNAVDPTKIGKFISLDCEMVGVGAEGETSMLARVSIVNYHGHVVLDEFVLPSEQVTDFRTAVSGITPKLLKTNGKPFQQVQKRVAEIIKNRVIIGHALKNDFKALLLSHPARLIRDTSLYKPLRHAKAKGPVALRKLVKEHLGMEIQQGQHSSVDDARAVMALYKKHKAQWESEKKRIEYRRNKLES